MIRLRPTLARLPQSQVRWAGTVGRPKGLKDHWSLDKVATNSAYPLAVAMRDLMLPLMTKKPSGTKAKTKTKPRVSSANTVSDSHIRTQLVSPGLCDDVLAYSHNLLQKHKGCDILDINPGAGLWSQKLHDYLKPRTHVLFEPQHSLFKDYLDPLLNAPNSRYKLVAKDPLSLPSYRELVDEGVFPHQIRVDPEDPTAQKINNTLLVTGSLVWDPRLPGMGFDSMAKQLYHHFASAAWTNDLFHAFGPVHTLFWVQSDDFAPMMAHSIAGIKKANRLLEMTQDLTMIVGSTRNERVGGKGSVTREPQHEIQSAMRALEAGKQRSIQIPEHRRDIIYSFATEIDKASIRAGLHPRDLMTADFMPDFLRSQQLAGKNVIGLTTQATVEHVELEKQIKSEYPDTCFHPLSTPPKDIKQSYKNHPAQKILRSFGRTRSLIHQNMSKRKACDAIADIGEKLYLLECKTLKMEQGPRKEAAIEEIEMLDGSWEQAIKNLDSNMQAVPVAELDERISLHHVPGPRIQWDKRHFEPLISHSSEAWPINRMSLLYTTPNPRPIGDTPDWAEWVTDFVGALYMEPSRPLIPVLESMQPGLSDIIKDCPSLKDPEKGGRMLLKHLRVRVLTMDMIYELVKAYRDWPFKAPGADHSMYFRNKARLMGRGRGMLYDAFARSH